MNEGRNWNFFFELFEGVFRLGPGTVEATEQAFAMVPDLPAKPSILDLGCGRGAQTLELVRLCDGTITAVDFHQPFLVKLEEQARELGYGDRIRTMQASFSEMELPEGAADLIWSEGAIYNVGFEKGLAEWNRYLKSGGCMAVTEAVWLKEDPPDELKAFWDAEYPAIMDAAGNLDAIERCGYQLLGHFTLPVRAWSDEYYAPLALRLDMLEKKYADNEEALAVFKEMRFEIEMFRKYGAWYGYEFFVMRKPEDA